MKGSQTPAPAAHASKYAPKELNQECHEGLCHAAQDGAQAPSIMSLVLGHIWQQHILGHD